MPSSACSRGRSDLHSFPTRRSSDLSIAAAQAAVERGQADAARLHLADAPVELRGWEWSYLQGMLDRSDRNLDLQAMGYTYAALDGEDRKSTRLNSSHGYISYAVFCLLPRPQRSTLFPYTTLFRSLDRGGAGGGGTRAGRRGAPPPRGCSRRAPWMGMELPAGHAGSERSQPGPAGHGIHVRRPGRRRSEEHTSELQSRLHLVCRLLLAPAAAAIYTLSLHDALPISRSRRRRRRWNAGRPTRRASTSRMLPSSSVDGNGATCRACWIGAIATWTCRPWDTRTPPWTAKIGRAHV